MTITVQNSNPVVDTADVIGKLAPLLLGKSESASSETAPDAAAVGRSTDLFNLLQQRGSSTAQADSVISDILYRAQLAFSPVLGEEKMAGVYNSSTKTLLANDAIARATSASAEAVFKMQQEALQTAAAVSNSQLSSTKKTTSQSKVNPGIPIGTTLKSLALGAGVTAGGKMAINKTKEILAKHFGGAATGTGPEMAGSEYGKGIENYFDSGQQAVDESGVDLSAFGPIGGGDFASGAGSAAGSEALAYTPAASQAAQLAFLGDATAIDPVVSDAGTSGVVGGDAATGSGISGAAVGGDEAAVTAAGAAAGLSSDTMQTIGPIGTQKALEGAGEAGAEGAGEGSIVGSLGDVALLPAGAGLAANDLNMIGGTNSAISESLGGDSISDMVKDIPIVGDIANIGGGGGWIICTELRKQQRLPRRFYVYGWKVFEAYPEKYKPGYYIWAIPTVQHLRRNPYSAYSRFICSIFNRRAEYLAALAGAPKARKLLSGWLVTQISYYFCVLLSKTIARKPINWEEVYSNANS